MPYASLGFGNTYSPERTTFRVYARDCDCLEVCLYRDHKTFRYISHTMGLVGDGIWELVLEGDFKGYYYVYRVHRGVVAYAATDPFAFASSANSRRSAIVDLSDATVPGFEADVFMPYRPQEAILYETHIRDMTMDPRLALKYPGKYLGVCELASNEQVGLRYLRNLGITHLHFLPLQDFLSVDEYDPRAYNWGYDPEQYFVPEGSYATDPDHPLTRVKELKQMVKACHDEGLAVVLDVVYNHTYRGGENPLAILAPNTYYRHLKDGSYANGSGCGNELNTEHPMVRQLILDSLVHWMKIYRIDGFRFDLMALMDVETAKLIVETVRSINPNAIIYGEPWTGGATPLSWEKQVLKGQQHALEIALFNDDYRNALKGDSDGKDHGFIQGYRAKMHDIKTGLVGSIQYDQNHRGFCIQPWETVNYLSAHDNLCLYDKLKYSTMWEDKKIKEATKLGFSLVLLAFGIPFIQAGTEMMRTKQMDHNSYKSDDRINAIQSVWSEIHGDLVHYFKDLITLRRYLQCYEAFDAKKIKSNVRFIGNLPVLAFSIVLDQHPNEQALVLINYLPHGVEVPIKRTDACRLVFNHYGFNAKGHRVPKIGLPLVMKGFETMVLMR